MKKNLKDKKSLNIAMLGHKRIPSREGGIEIVVEELATRMVTLGHKVTCYNRSGHHVSGKDFDGGKRKAYKGVRLKSVLTLDIPHREGEILLLTDIIRKAFKPAGGATQEEKDKLRNYRVFFTSRKTLLNEFNHENYVDAMRCLVYNSQHGGMLMGKREELIELKNKSGMNWKQFSEYYEIPYRTIQDWEHGKREMPDYVLRLMQYKMKMEELLKMGGNDDRK